MGNGSMLWMIVILFGVMWLFMIRPQKNQEKRDAEENLKNQQMAAQNKPKEKKTRKKKADVQSPTLGLE